LVLIASALSSTKYWNADNVNISISGLFVNEEGYVGIGTTEPKAKLDVKGGVRINGNSVAGSYNTMLAKENTITNVSLFGSLADITIGSDGLPIISQRYLGDLHVYKCLNLECSEWVNVTVDTTNVLYNSIAIGLDGLPIIVYQQSTTIMAAKCNNMNCSSSTINTVTSSANSIGNYLSMKIGIDGRPVIAHYDFTNGDLRVAKCGNAICSSGNVDNSVDTTNDVGVYPSLAIGIDGLPIIAEYESFPGADLRVVHCGNQACTSGNTITAVETANQVGVFPSIAIGDDGLAIIAHNHWDSTALRVFKCSNVVCSSGIGYEVDNTGDVGRDTAIMIGLDGFPIIVHYDAINSNLHFTRCGTKDCSGNYLNKVFDTQSVSGFGTITLGSDGLPIFTYNANRQRVVHCANPWCLNYWTRR